MTTYTKTLAKAGDRVLGTVTDAQSTIVQAVATASDTAATFLPALPLPTLSAKVPTARELLEQGFSFAEKALKAQRTYALGIVDALEPVTGKLINHAPRKTRKASSSTAA